MLKIIFCLHFCLSSSFAYVNLALNKETFEQYPRLIRYNVASNKAVDGIKPDQNYSDEQCSFSKAEKTATWWVNLNSVYNINDIRIYYANESGWGNWYKGLRLGFSIYVSNTTNKSDGVLCYKDNNFTLDTFPEVLDTQCPVYGQYVIYYNERLLGVTYPEDYSNDVFNSLCEVEVYGCPVLGHYGADCNVSCSDADCCYSHVETGTCQGCYSESEGLQCRFEQNTCIEDKTDGILWKATFAGRNKEIPCPENQNGVATRFCDEHGEWNLPNLINCTNEALVNASSLLDGIIANKTQDKFRIQKTVNNTLQLMKKLTSSTSGISAGDLSSSLGVLEKIVTVTNATGSVIEKEVFYAVIDNILSPNNSNSWTTISEQTENGPTFLLKNMDRFSKITLQNDNITATKFNGFNFELVINQTKIDETRIRFPDEQSNKVSPNPEESLTFLELPKQASNATKAINYVAVLYKTMSDILGSDSNSKELKGKQAKKSKQRSFVNSPILSLTTQTDLGVLDPPLNLRFGHTIKKESTEMRALCVSWDFNLNKWSEEGCTVIQTDRQRTVCHCNHLTNFAILMRPYTQVSEESPFLKTMSFVGIALSIAFTFLTSLIYILTWRYIRSDKNIMMLNICGSLILSYTIFISSVEQTSNEVACVAITAIIHYFFLVTFFSMLGLGVYYFMSITVTYYALYVANNFKSKSRIHWFLGGIWGIPVIITTTNLGAFWGKGYHLKSYCWLSIESGSLYMFIIPVCLISLINILIIVSLLRVLFASSIVARSSLQRKASSGLRSLGTLLPVLGVTWLFGILAVNENAVVFQYLFVIANSFQGFLIFVSHVLLDKKVRQGIGNRYPSLSTIFSFAERGTKETTISSPSPSTSKSNEPKSLVKRFWQTKEKKSELSMSEKTMSTSCPQSVSHAKRNETNSD
ncbi:adhesion G protein-coupled receptor E3-like isoform X3 [Crassostrea angulata]|uniref:adhesion G protein-coupled receptor E3-like isoform X3 n=2 Tax=Magallana angulata TaxID=2784310 RepID=UPI0022B14713|nr:adhesion G protein-coupled receptor E3-like isoform X3 [Crassostrea angulata]